MRCKARSQAHTASYVETLPAADGPIPVDSGPDTGVGQPKGNGLGACRVLSHRGSSTPYNKALNSLAIVQRSSYARIGCNKQVMAPPFAACPRQHAQQTSCKSLSSTQHSGKHSISRWVCCCAGLQGFADASERSKHWNRPSTSQEQAAEINSNMPSS